MANLIFKDTGVEGKILGRITPGVNLFVLDNGFIAFYNIELKRWSLIASASNMSSRVKWDEQVQQKMYYAIYGKR